ncbi:MAG: AzlD domain-containing protein [Hyphomicrobiales bacterium]|nr:AzlD domain-containing protein [Hyphomicrobiales bacterium]
MSGEIATFLAIAGMALVTYATRGLGPWMIARLAPGPRALAALEALPAAILTALVAPSVLATGPAESLAAIVTIIVAQRLPIIATMAIGVACVVLLRYLI